MTSTEAQESLTNSLQVQDLIKFESEKEIKQLLNTQIDQNSSVDTPSNEKNNLTIANTVSDIKGIEKTSNSDDKEHENDEEVIILDSNSAERNNTSKIEDIQNVKESDIISSEVENGSKSNRNDNVKQSTTKSGNSLKRKQRSFDTQEVDSLIEEPNSRSKRKKKSTNDRFCWRCHKESVEAHCSACPRSWHRRCIGMQPSSIQNWICGECAAILRAENAETRSTAMAQLSVDQLCLLLKHVVERMREYPGSEPFWKPVELSEALNYMDYVVKPMDLSLLESNVRAKLYGSTDAFMADAKWIQHNCIVFNTCGGVYTDTSKLTNAAKQIIKMARQEVSEIEACPDCYAHGRNLPRPQPSWFIEPCRRPHPLVWAKLKGFPFWPAKAMPRLNSQGFVDVRFFGEHDRAWVSPRDLYLYSEEPPVPLPRKRKLDMEECVREITRHCRKLELVFGQFKFAPPKVQYNPHDPMQIKLMLPNYDPLRSNNYISSQFLIPKKKSTLKKRLHVKSKSQTDTVKVDNSDIEKKMLPSLHTCTEQDQIEEKPLKEAQTKESESELVVTTHDDSNLSLSLNELMAKERKQDLKAADLLITEKETKEDIKPGTSKIVVMKNMNENDTVKCNTNESNLIILEQNNNSKKVINDNAESSESLPTPAIPSLNTQSTMNDVEQIVRNESSIMGSDTKTDTVNQNSLCMAKSNFKSTKNVGKVYKPKTRMVDKVNAEKALKSIVNEQNQKSIMTESTISVIQANPSNSSSNGSVSSPISVSAGGKTKTENTDVQSSKKMSLDQSVALFFVVNNGTTTDSIKKSANSLTVTEKGGNQQSQKDTSQTAHKKKESKARKSFPNKTSRTCSQLVSHSATSTLSNSIDSIAYIPSHQTEKCIDYQMLPPEAGPLSARLYHDAQDLAKKMAQLMEEAYKEAAQENQNCETSTNENHQATVHFLRLQIERMRWQHQQQIAELKHNTDRILREMKASLEAERLRAIEETRKEVEEEKLRCIEEIKRKQWCAMCGREALFYCCWNTAYCDYPCQQSHWPMHMRTCAQKPSFTIVTSSAASSNQQQAMPRLMINTQHATSNAWRA
ncbi:zinc finger MYND-type containing 8 [Calliopsis andreniformis]|uniref:zinc finger MYND-type containing 8 n=1 Tax=Calliopsis andreniformis TaxID=337506 RepID=UPI003FCE542F